MSGSTGQQRASVGGELPEIGTLSVALFDFEGEREDMLHLNAGDVITLIEMNDNGWWKGANIHGHVGIFPYSYVEVKMSSQEAFPIARALFDLPPDASDPELLSFAQHELITITRGVNEHWSYGRRANGDLGRFPLKYVEMTGEYDEALFKKEVEKWEVIEQKRAQELERLRSEKEALELQQLQSAMEKMRAEAKAQQEELERTKKELEAMRERNKQEAEELEKQKAKMKNMTLRADVEKVEQRAKKAEAELESARAEAALLRRLQERKDARKSVAIRDKIEGDAQEIRRKLQRVGTQFNGEAPGPPPKRFNEVDLTEENLEIDEDPFADQDFGTRTKTKKKLTPMMKPIYQGKTESPKPKVPAINLSKVSSIADKETITKVTEPEPKKEPDNPPPKGVVYNADRSKRKVNKRFAHLGKGDKCKSCNKSVGIANRVKACKGVYHDTCFRCATCDKIIRNGEYVDRNDNPYCRLCHQRGFGPKGFGFGLNDGAQGTAAEAKEGKPAAKGQVVTQSWV